MEHPNKVPLTQILLLRSAQCPDPYVPLDQALCIYVDPFVGYNYKDTIALCKSHGGDILMIDDCYTLGLVYDFIDSQAVTAGKHYWLGASDEQAEGIWKFVDNRPVPMGTPFWGTTEPNNGPTYNCAILHASYNHQWYDIPCTGTYFPICLRKI
ncbi:C-type lectin domain family 17, member A-like [Palaemon carinicauda]|uniref:C-type lectin domain family 17, member A-like n=1 Tax=Palaemon carinicauda TaxID=392227 RepID=UPI0035B67D08